MSFNEPHSCQQLPFSSFSLTFCFDKGCCPPAAAWEVDAFQGSTAGPRLSAPPPGATRLFGHAQNFVSTPSFSFDFIIPLHSLPILHHISGSHSLLTQGGRWRLGNRECKDKVRPLPQKLHQPIAICGVFYPPRGMGSAVVLFFSVSRAGLVLLSLLSQCGVCSAARGFLFLCADVGAHFSKLKRRKPK